MVRVIDASVAVKWFVIETGYEKAFALLEEVLAAPDRFAVPELFYFELAHVFHRAVALPKETQVALLVQIVTLGIRRFSMTPTLLSEIRELQRMGLSGYDASYVALAKVLDGKWVTCDAKAHALVADLNLSTLL